MPFGLVPEILDAVDVVGLIGKELGVIDPHVLECRDVQRIIASKAVGVDGRIRPDFVPDDRKKRCGRYI